MAALPATEAAAGKRRPRRRAPRRERNASWGAFETLGALGAHEGFTIPPAARVFENLDRVRGYCRDMLQLTFAGRQFAREMEINLADDGAPHAQSLAMDADGEPLDEFRKEAEARFKNWMADGRACGFVGEWNFRAMTEQVVKHLCADGEAFVMTHGGAEGLRLQVIDPARVPTDYFGASSSGARRVFMGVELDKDGRKLGYYIGDEPTRFGAAYTLYSQAINRAQRVPASRVLHVRTPDFIGQVRGLPLMLSALREISTLDGFTGAALKHAQAGASNLAIFVESEDAIGGDEAELDESEMRVHDLAGGVRALEAPPGSSAQPFPSRFPDAAFASFVSAVGHQIAAGLGLPFHRLFSDLSGVNYSSARVGELHFEQHLSNVRAALAQTLYRPVWRRWLARALASGKMEAPANARFEDLALVQFGAGRGLGVVDKVKHAQAMEKLLASRAISPIDAIRATGGDPAEVAAGWKLAEEMGLMPTIPNAPADAQPAGASKDMPDDDGGDKPADGGGDDKPDDTGDDGDDDTQRSE